MSMPNPNTLTFIAAEKYDAAGISVLPIRSDGSKGPAVAHWKELQTRRLTAEERSAVFANGNWIGAIAGAVSGNLNPLDFDCPGLCDDFEAVCAEHGFGDLVQRLPRIQTPSGGDHLYLRTETPPPGNEKLARGADGKKTLIETRGEGGYVVAPPSDGYRFVRGAKGFPDNIPVITDEERHALWAFAALFNEYFPEEQRAAEMQQSAGGEGKPGTAFNDRGNVEELLQKHGWKCLARRGKKGLWQRPGKDGRGISATTNYADSGLFYVFSSNAMPFEEKKAYSPWRVYAFLEHGGDFAAAARELGRQGYGDPPAKPTKKSSPSTKPTDEESEEPKEPTVTEIDLAQVWAERVQGEFCFVEGAQWWRYEGNHWHYRQEEEPRESVQRFLMDRGKCTPARVRNVLFLSASLLGPVRMTSFNAHPAWIPLRNGVYDTESTQIIEHDPQHLLTYQLPYDYAPDADCPTWKRCLQEWLITNGGEPCKEWIDLVQEWFGYCLLPDNTAQLSLFWVGEGGNGKGVATRVLEELVGSGSCVSIPVDQLHDPYHRADLQGKLVGLVNEPDRRAMQKNGNWFKMITGGDDPISARRPSEKVFSFKSVCRIIVTCNELPATSDPSRAYFRRIIPMEWRANIAEDKRDPELNRKLSHELPGIFNWAMEGLQRWKARGRRFVIPDESKRMLEEYKLDQDHLRRFIQESLSFVAGAFCPANDLYTLYKGWCEGEGIKPETNNAFGRRLAKHGCERILKRIDGEVVRVWQGVRYAACQADADDDSDDQYTA